MLSKHIRAFWLNKLTKITTFAMKYPFRMQTITLEICANGIESMRIGQAFFASRVELCENLEIGGTTPSYGCLQLAAGLKNRPVHVLIKPRGGHYCYSKHEQEQMLQDIELVKSMGFEGIVIGALKPGGNLDMQALETFAKAATGLKLIFHRAIDACNNPLEAIPELINLGFDAVLTSGGFPKACQGVYNIKKMYEKYGTQIEVMAGGGILASNVIDLLRTTNINAIHLSAKQKLPVPVAWPKGTDQTDANMQTHASDPNKIKQLIDQLTSEGYGINESVVKG